MSLWTEGKRGRLWIQGKDAPEKAAKEAASCGYFSPDYEEECFAEEDVSCYNCKYRRWTSESFECMNKERLG